MDASDCPSRPATWKLTEPKRERLLRMILAGATVAQSAKAVGCSKRTVQRQARRDELFGWRLGVAIDVRERLRRRRQEEGQELDSPEVRLWFYALLEALRREWGDTRPR